MPGHPIVIHGLNDARAAAQAAASLGVPVTLQSMPGAGASAGAGWFERLIASVRAEFPAVDVTAILDCDDAPGAVMAALRWLKEPGRAGLVLAFSGDAPTAQRLEDMAAQIGIRLVRHTEPGLDLRSARDPDAACRAWLSETAPSRVAAP